MKFSRKKQGGVLVYVLIVSIAMVITLTSLLQAAGIEGYNLANENNEISRYFAANSGLEILRGILYYDTRETFASYLNQKSDLENKVMKYEGWNITFSIDNNMIDDGWGSTTNDGDGILAIHSTAYNGDAFISEGLEITSQVMLQMTTKYSFANNTWANAQIQGIQHWYGNVYWYSPNGGTPSFATDSKCIFYNSLRSWEFSSTNKSRTEYNENFTNHIAFSYTYPYRSGSVYTYDSGPITPDRKFTDEVPHQPLPGINEIQFEFGDRSTKGSIEYAAYNQTVDGNRTHYFSDGLGTGAVSGEVLPDNVELFFHPDGSVWWRKCGDGASDWRKKDITQDQGTIIYAKGSIWVRGVVNKRMTVAAGNDIYINGNIRNSNFNEAHLVLISKDDIFEEVRKEVKQWDGSYKISVPLAESTKVTVDASSGNYIANRIFTDEEVETMKTSYPWLAADLESWKDRPGALSKSTLIEASLVSSDRIVPSQRFTHTTSTWYHDNRGGRWEVKGTYFIGSTQMPPCDYVENWSEGGGEAYYNEHNGARSTPPPFGITIKDRYPVYRMDGSFWRMKIVNAGAN